MQEKTDESKVLTLPFQKVSVAPYPQVTTVLGVNENTKSLQDLPAVSAQSFIALDKASQVPLFSKNKDFLFSMASTTKIMTALVALDHYKLDDVLTVRRDGVEGAKVGMRMGQQFRFQDVLYGMLLPSGNDAAYAIADNYPGGADVFVLKMNEKARSYNLFKTHFVDPAGLEDADYTTASDLARLASIAMDNPIFKEVVGTKRTTIQSLAGTTYPIENLNRLLGFDHVEGVKTGFTETAGQVLVTSRTVDNHTIITVVMKSEDRFSDTQQLLSLLSGNVSYTSY